ncbi:MAG: hypothetical protein PVF34_05905, partial [Gammaproteobacteria bacterium]
KGKYQQFIVHKIPTKLRNWRTQKHKSSNPEIPEFIQRLTAGRRNSLSFISQFAGAVFVLTYCNKKVLPGYGEGCFWTGEPGQYDRRKPASAADAKSGAVQGFLNCLAGSGFCHL